MKLKTLKDLKWKSEEIEGYLNLGILPVDFKPKNSYFICEGNLRAEAIKRARWRFKYHTEYKLGEDFINFFNITEEDLK